MDYPVIPAEFTDLQRTYGGWLVPTDKWYRSGTDYWVLAFAPGYWPVRVAREDPNPPESRWTACDVAPSFTEGRIELVFHPRATPYPLASDEVVFHLSSSIDQLSAGSLGSLSNEDRKMVSGQLLDLFQQYVANDTHGLLLNELHRKIDWLRSQAVEAGLTVARDDASALAMAKQEQAKDGLPAAARDWLGLSAFEGWTDTLEYLLQSGAAPDPSDGRHCSPLYVAIWAGEVQAVRVLLEHGASVDAVAYMGQTPLEMAATCANPQITGLLLDKGADVNQIESGLGGFGFTPLQKAVQKRDWAMAARLLERGASPEFYASESRSPLVIAVENDDEGMLELLLDAGADVNRCDKYGYLVLDHASPDFIRIVLNHGADPTLRNGHGKRAIDRPEVQALLGLTKESRAASRPASAALRWVGCLPHPGGCKEATETCSASTAPLRIRT